MEDFYLKISVLLTMFFFIFTCVLHTGCGEDEVEIANFVDVVCVNGKVEILFDAEPTDVYVEHSQYLSIEGQIVFSTPHWGPSRAQWEVEGNKIITDGETVFPDAPNLTVVTNVRWGQPNKKT